MVERRSDAGPPDAASPLKQMPANPAGICLPRQLAGSASSAPAQPIAPRGVDDRPILAATRPGGSPATRRARRLGLRLALGGLLVVMLSVGMLFAPALWQGHDDPVVIPPRVGALVVDNHPGARETVHQLRHAIESGISLPMTGAVYADEAGQSRSVIFVAGRGALASPRESLDKALAITVAALGGTAEIRQMPAGPSGGVLKCGLITTEGSTSVCGWVDDTSLGVAAFPNRGIPDSADVLRALRQATRSQR